MAVNLQLDEKSDCWHLNAVADENCGIKKMLVKFLAFLNNKNQITCQN